MKTQEIFHKNNLEIIKQALQNFNRIDMKGGITFMRWKILHRELIRCVIHSLQINRL